MMLLASSGIICCCTVRHGNQRLSLAVVLLMLRDVIIMQLLKLDVGGQVLWRPDDEIVTTYCTPYTPGDLCRDMASAHTTAGYEAFLVLLGRIYPSLGIRDAMFQRNPLVADLVRAMICQLTPAICNSLQTLHSARSIDVTLPGHARSTTIHTGDNVSRGLQIDSSNNQVFDIGHIVGIYTNLDKGVTAAGVTTIHASSGSLDQTYVLVLKYTSIRVSHEGARDLQDHHPLVRCLKEARFPKRIPYFEGLTMKPFHVVRCTNELALWPLQEISGHAMCVPERCRLLGSMAEAAGLVDPMIAFPPFPAVPNPTEVPSDPTPIILDISASAIHHRYYRN